jgi:GTPase
MKFVDQVRIQVKAGDGGNGAVAFRREKYVEKGGPSGGDGGHGGSVIFVVDPSLTTLLDFQYQQHLVARHGGHGLGSDCNGKNADDLVLPIPVGTLVIDHASGEELADLSTPGERWVAAKGGRGGLGNMNFTTSTRQAPRFAQDGTPGEERVLVLELKLLADVGLIGFPNAGKSTFVSRVSRARPKVADYPFTTLVPHLGVVAYRDRKSFVVADIPGLIEGASEGHGLGHQFLRHVERCRVLVHLVDLGCQDEGRAPLKDFDTINRELARHSPALADKPQVVVANKLDLPHAREALPAFEKALKRRGVAVLPLSGATGQGLQAVLDACAQVLFSSKPPAPLRRPLPARRPAKAPAVPRLRTGRSVTNRRGSPRKKAPRA